MEAIAVERVHILQDIATFGGIDDENLTFLLEIANDLEFEPGETIFCEGDYTASMFVIELGQVGIYRERRSKNHLITTLNAGDCLGEMALFDYMPRSSTAVAKNHCQLIEITAHHLYQLYKRNIEQFSLLQMNLGREIARRLRVVDELYLESLDKLRSEPNDR